MAFGQWTRATERQERRGEGQLGWREKRRGPAGVAGEKRRRFNYIDGAQRIARRAAATLFFANEATTLLGGI